jgi:hypothetical protein
MALTRAQLLSGDINNGAILSGQPQGVRPGGAGITIATDGIISVNSQTVVGLMKLGQTGPSAGAAYNGYTWPIGPGSAGQQLTTDGAGLLSWANPGVSPYTAKGQLVVGTGPAADTLLNVGTDTSFLVANSGSISGLAYTNTLTSAALLPVGNNTTQRPAAPVVGQIRYNSTDNVFEGYGGSPAAWSAIGAPPTAGLGINITGSLVKVSIPTASTPPTPGAGATGAVVGSMYWDDNLNQLFIYYSNGGAPTWVQAAPAATGGGSTVTAASLAEAAAGTINTKFLSPETGVPKNAAGMTGAAILPGGDNAQRPGTPAGGWLRWNNDAASTIGNRAEVYNPATTSWRPLEYATPQPVTTDYTVTNGQVLSGSILCKNFTVPAGVTATVASGVSVVSTGTVTIAGTLNGAGLGAQGAAYYATFVYPGTNVYVGPGFGLSPGSSSSPGKAYSPVLSLTGSGGSGGFVGNANPVGGISLFATSGTGGNAGSSVLIRCYGTISVTGTINCNGSAGDIADRTAGNPAIVTGPGGGSGGTIILDADGNCTNSGTLTANGGAGANGHNIFASGGGGGGGGWIIVQSRFGIATTGTTSVTGGAAGGNAPSASIGGGGGGGNGGTGGFGSDGTHPLPEAGSTGIVQTYGSPL